MNRLQVLSSPRLAGAVKRYHTWPTTQSQSVAEHTWNMMMIWYAIWGPLPSVISTYILWHDCGELAVGDIPFPVKSQNEQLRMLIDDQETKALASMSYTHPVTLDPIDRKRVKLCDLIEMHEFGKMEEKLGNAFAGPIIRDTMAAITNLLADLPSAVDVKAVNTYLMGI
jgi:5'-deoxynucleotidase YfbR-like HD superfamily hydrolase